MDLEESTVTGVPWIHILHDQDLSKDFVNATLKLRLKHSWRVTAV